MKNREWLSVKDMIGESSADLGNSRMNIVEMKVKELHMFKDHPFKLYEGERLEQMVQSIKDFGVITPVIVRPLKRGKYEILAGHNRVNAAKLAGLEAVPVMVKSISNDEDAMFIVTETNLMQRSFSEMRYSERAFALEKHHTASIKQGKRTDLWNQIDGIENEEHATTFRQVGEKLYTDRKIGDAFQLSPRTVSRYLRICELIRPLQQRLDDGEIAFTIAETLSYMNRKNQEVLELFLKDHVTKISAKQAQLLKIQGADTELGLKDIEGILLCKEVTPKKVKSIEIGSEVITRFFGRMSSKQEIEEIVVKALEQYLNIS